MPILEVEGIQKAFGSIKVLEDISFSLEAGHTLGLIGSSGSGKTTLLRCLNFLETPDSGVIRVNGETLFDASIPASLQEKELRRKRLHFGLVFQSFNLFPQYTALQNVMIGEELLARSRPDWRANRREITAGIECHARELLAQMDCFISKFGELRDALEAGDEDKMREMMKISTERRSYFDKR